MLPSIANGLASVLTVVFNMVQLIVLASVIMSWVNADPNNQIVQAIHRMTEPLYRPLRRLTRNIPGPFDWAPFVLLLIVIFLQSSVVRYLKHYAAANMG